MRFLAFIILALWWTASLAVLVWGVTNVTGSDNSDAAALAVMTLFPGAVMVLIAIAASLVYWLL